MIFCPGYLDRINIKDGILIFGVEVCPAGKYGNRFGISGLRVNKYNPEVILFEIKNQ